MKQEPWPARAENPRPSGRGEVNALRILEWSPGAAGPLLRDRLPWQADDEDLSWHDRALCAQTDPDAFFPEKGASTREAKRICRACEVRAECLEYALAHDERFGVWGGLSERERRRMRRETEGTSPPRHPRAAERAAELAIYRRMAGQGLATEVIAERMGLPRHGVWRLARRARDEDKAAAA